MTRPLLRKKKIRKVLTEEKLDDFGSSVETYPRNSVAPVVRSVLVVKILSSYGNKRSKTTPV